MLKTARIFNLFLLVLAGAATLSTAFKISSFPELIGSTVGFALTLSPLWLSLLVLGPTRPRIEKAALLLNKIALFLLACGIVAIIFSLTDSRLGLSFLPIIIMLFIASSLNIAAINKQIKQRIAAALNSEVNTDAPR